VRALVSLVFCAAFLAACGDRTEPPSGESVRPLNEVPLEQLRTFLKGYPGDWQNDSDLAKEIPPPPATKPVPPDAQLIDLPPGSAFTAFDASLTDVFVDRRSLRSYSAAPLSLEELSYLMWATQGITHIEEDADDKTTREYRTAPSAGGRYPLETYLVVNRVKDLAPGIYRYLPASHQLTLISEDAGAAHKLSIACYNQAFVADAPLAVVWTATPYRTEWKYAYLAHRMIAMEAGHVCQNLYLAATAIDAGACALLSYHQPALDALLSVDGQDEFVIYLACVGKPDKSQ
jgi:SagB-type dehydrogenase family enzyme